MKLDTRQRVFGACLLLLLCTSECISIKTQIDHTLNSKAQFTTVHQLSKAVSLVQDNMDVFSENFDPNDILEVVNGPLFEKAIASNLDVLSRRHVDVLLETYESSKTTHAVENIGHKLHKLAHKAVPASHFAAHAGHHKEHHESKCEKADGRCIDVSDESALTCSSETRIGLCPGNKYIQCCVGKVVRKKVSESSGETNSVGTLKVYFEKAKTTRDMDLFGGKSDLMFEVAVGNEKKGTRVAQVSMVHDNTHKIDFSKEADRVYTFRNVRPDTSFSIKAFDDDVIGYEQIGHTNHFTAGKNRDTTTAFRYNAKVCPKNALIKKGSKAEVCRGGSITFKSRFTPGRVAVPGEENNEVVTKHVAGFPNYDMESYQKKGTPSDRARARFHGAVEGLLVGLLFGLPDLFKDSSVKEAGRSFLSDAKESFEPVFEQFENFQEELGKLLKDGLKLHTVKVVFKELLKVMKSFLNFFATLYKKNVLWKMLFMMVGMIAVFTVVGVVMAAAGIPAIAMTIVNLLFTLPYIWDQIKLIGPNFVKCKKQADGCTLQNLNKGFGAIGRIVGTVAVETLMLGGFNSLARRAKTLLSKKKPSLAKQLDVGGLDKLKKSASGKNSKKAKQIVDDMPCKICGRRRRLFQSSCCMYRGNGKKNGNIITDKKELEYIESTKKHAEWEAQQPKTYDNDMATRNRLNGRGNEKKIIDGLGDHVKYPDQALNPNLFKERIKPPKGHVYKWNLVVKQKILKYQESYRQYLHYKSWGGQKPGPLKLTDWDGATEALRKDALRGVQPPLESIVPGAPGSRWKLADELVGIVTDQNYKGHLDSRGYPKEWDPAIFGDRLDITWRGIPTAADLKEYRALLAKATKKGKAAPLTPGEKYKKYLYKKEGMHNMNDAAKARAYRLGRL